MKNHIKTLAFTILDILKIKKIDDCENIYSVNPLYLRINHESGYIQEKDVNKYLIFGSTDENKELLKKYNDAFDGIRAKMKEVTKDEYDYENNYMKTKFNSDDDLPLNKPLKFHLMTITIRSVFVEDGKWYFKNIVFKYEPYQKAMSFNDIAIVSVKGNTYRIHF